MSKFFFLFNFSNKNKHPFRTKKSGVDTNVFSEIGQVNNLNIAQQNNVEDFGLDNNNINIENNDDMEN